jgi:predicted dehydrogenase
MILRQKGLLVVVGDVSMDIPRRDYYAKEIDIRISRSYGPGRYDPTYEEGGMDYPYAYVRWTENRNMESFLDLAARQAIQLAPMTTHTFPIDQAIDAYRLLDHPGEDKNPLGIVVEYPRDSESLPQPTDPISIRPRSPHASIRLGFIGAGSFTKSVLLPAFQTVNSLELVTIASSGGLTAAETARRFGFSEAASSADAVISNPDINAVVITTRHDSHAEYVNKALEAGKAVFVEKPLCLTESELASILKTHASGSESGSPLLMVGFNRRFSPLLQPLKSALSELSSPKSMLYRVNAGELPADSWIHDPKMGGGRIIGEACHFIDTMSWLCDAAPARVMASAMMTPGEVTPDTQSISIEFEDGSIGTLMYVSNGHPSLAKEYIEVHAGGRSAIVQNFKTVDSYGFSRVKPTRSRTQRKGHHEEVTAFCECLRTGSPSPMSIEYLAKISRTTFAVQDVLRSGQTQLIP